MFKRIAVVQVLASGGFLASFTYIALLGDEMGLSRSQIAIMAMLYAVAQFFSSFLFGRLADDQGKRRILLLGLFSLIFLVVLQALGWDRYSIWTFRTLTGIGFGIYPAALAAYAYEGKAKMGKFSSFGALGWGAALLIAGPIGDIFGVRSVFIMVSVMMIVAFIVALTFKKIPEVRIRSPLLPIEMIKKNREIIFPLILRHATASSIWVLWPLFLTEKIGLSLFEMGIVQATNAFTQFIAMYLLGDRIGPKKAVGLGLILTSMAVLSFTVINSFPLFLLTQVILGLSWANLFVGSLRSIMIKNKERATAAGLLNSSLSLSGLLGPVIALVLVELIPDIPYKGPMYFAGIVSFCAFLYFAFFGMKRVPSR